MNGTQLTELEQRIRTDYSNIAGMVVRKDGKTVYEDRKSVGRERV